MASTHPSLHLSHPTPDLFIWNSILRSHPNPISLYPRILRHCSHPDSFTFPLLLSSLSNPTLLPQLHSQILIFGLFNHPHVLSSLISSYSSIPSHLLLFLSLPLPFHDLPTSNSLLSSLLRAGHLLTAHKLFDKMPRRDVISWSSLIHGHASLGCPRTALSLFCAMLSDPRAPPPNPFTLSAVLTACACLGALHHGLWTHAFISRGGISINAVLATSLIHMYSKCGRIQRAREVFDQLPARIRDTTAWTAIITALAVHGLAPEALSLFHDMVGSPGLKPNSVTLMSVLQACVHGGLVREGERYFAAMSKEFCMALSVHSEIHKFFAGDISALGAEGLYLMVEEMMRRLKTVGYVGNSKEVLLDLEEEGKELALSVHSEKLAVAFGLMKTRRGTEIRVVKNLRICVDCHEAIRLVSRVYARDISVRDCNRFHHFRDGDCSCKNYW